MEKIRYWLFIWSLIRSVLLSMSFSSLADIRRFVVIFRRQRRVKEERKMYSCLIKTQKTAALFYQEYEASIALSLYGAKGYLDFGDKWVFPFGSPSGSTVDWELVIKFCRDKDADGDDVLCQSLSS